MRSIVIIALVLCGVLVFLIQWRSRGASVAVDVISLERAALDRWGQGDPSVLLETYAPEITYFDPRVERRIDGHAAMVDYYRPAIGKINVPRYEMIDPKVQRHGDVAVLTYNLRSDAVLPDGDRNTVHWNSTSVYARMGRDWKIIHSHWSLTALPGAKGDM